MSLSLRLGTLPKGLEVRSTGIEPYQRVFVGDYEISMADILVVAHYALTNTDLKPHDLRLQFVKCVQAMKVIDGYNPGNQRLHSEVSPIKL